MISAVAAVATETQAPAPVHRFKRVGKPPAKAAARPAVPVERKVEPFPAAPVEPVVVTVQRPAEKAGTGKAVSADRREACTASRGARGAGCR